jgi:hypothetical protein
MPRPFHIAAQNAFKKMAFQMLLGKPSGLPPGAAGPCGSCSPMKHAFAGSTGHGRAGPRSAEGRSNGRIRRWLPRHSDIDGLADEEFQDRVLTANLTPRKCLGFKTPLQAILKELGKDVQIRFT